MISDTSIQSYDEIINSGLVGTGQQRVMEVLQYKGTLTDSEITETLGDTDPNKVRPRRRELVQMGIVTSYGKRFCTITQKEVYQWGIAQQIVFKPLNKERHPCSHCHGKGYIVTLLNSGKIHL